MRETNKPPNERGQSQPLVLGESFKLLSFGIRHSDDDGRRTLGPWRLRLRVAHEWIHVASTDGVHVESISLDHFGRRLGGIHGSWMPWSGRGCCDVRRALSVRTGPVRH